MSAGSLTASQVSAGNFAASHFRPDQGRVLYHMERVFRSAGGNGCLAHLDYLTLCEEHALPRLVNHWSPAQCVRGLQLIERAARGRGMHWYRDVRTQWEPLADAIWRHAPEELRAGLRKRLYEDCWVFAPARTEN